jgi:hypothetical protein
LGDLHDTQVRINVLENTKFEANLGTKADYRVLSYKMGKDVCCIQPKDKHPPDNERLTYLVSSAGCLRSEQARRPQQESGKMDTERGRVAHCSLIERLATQSVEDARNVALAPMHNSPRLNSVHALGFESRQC